MMRQIIAVGGKMLTPDEGKFALERYVLDACGKERPRVCFVPTASGDEPTHVARFYETYARFGCVLAHLPFFRRTPADLRAFVLGFDVIHVGGGNTRSMLAVWRHWGMDAIVREAWEGGVVLTGSSAGMVCWFEQAVTDSVASALTSMPALGFLAGSACPHYDGEAERRPAYQRMVAGGELASGYAADDGVGLHFIDDRLEAVVTERPTARGYRVERTGEQVRETALEMRVLA